MLRPSTPSSDGPNVVESTNWSGYAVTGKKLTSVAASWVQPLVTCTKGTKGSAFWVGLDGLASQTIEQTGTESDCSGSSPFYRSWYEMYPAASVYFTSTVKAGDHFTASVTFSGTGTYTLVLKDVTRGWTHTEKMNEPGLARSSAEVITEALYSPTGVVPLADFGTVDYTAATVNGTPMSSQSAVKFIMVDSNPSHLVKDTTSTITADGDFSNTWLRSS